MRNLFYILCSWYILLVGNNFGSSESILSIFVESGHESTSLTTSLSLRLIYATRWYETFLMMGKITLIFQRFCVCVRLLVTDKNNKSGAIHSLQSLKHVTIVFYEHWLCLTITFKDCTG